MIEQRLRNSGIRQAGVQPDGSDRIRVLLRVTAMIEPLHFFECLFLSPVATVVAVQDYDRLWGKSGNRAVLPFVKHLTLPRLKAVERSSPNERVS
jgi:hypothetical protein